MWAAISASSLPSSQRKKFNDGSRVRSPHRTSQRIGRVFRGPREGNRPRTNSDPPLALDNLKADRLRADNTQAALSLVSSPNCRRGLLPNCIRPAGLTTRDRRVNGGQDARSFPCVVTARDGATPTGSRRIWIKGHDLAALARAAAEQLDASSDACGYLLFSPKVPHPSGVFLEVVHDDCSALVGPMAGPTLPPRAIMSASIRCRISWRVSGPVLKATRWLPTPKCARARARRDHEYASLRAEGPPAGTATSPSWDALVCTTGHWNFESPEEAEQA
jgi:hypothetical protein